MIEDTTAIIAEFANRMAQVEVYAVGVVHCSACAPADMPPEEVAKAANLLHPTGLSHGWEISKDPTFASGQPNPCVCESDPSRKHWLLEC